MKTTKNDDLIEAMQQWNLVYNCDFRYFSNQVKNGETTDYGIPDGWLYADSGRSGKISFDPEKLSCLITKSEEKQEMSFSQMLHEFPRWQAALLGKTVSAKVWLSVSVPSTVAVHLSDGIDQDTVSKTGNGEFEFDLQLRVNPTAKKLMLSVTSGTPHVKIYIREVCANVGLVAVRNLPCMVQGIIGQRCQYVATETAPAGELSLCAPSAELGADYTRLDSVLNQRFGKGANNRSLLPDMRGYFSRSWDNGAGTDPDAKERQAFGGTLSGDHVGTKEPDVFFKHKHELKFSRDKTIFTGTAGAAIVIDPTKTSFTEEEGGKETRPKNVAELYTIKWA